MTPEQQRRALIDRVREEIVLLAEAIEFGMARAGDERRLALLIAYRDALYGLDVMREPVTFPTPPDV